MHSDEIVRLVLLETRQLYEEIATLLEAVPGGAAYASDAAESDPKLAAQLLTLHLTAQRNKRCLLVYHQYRMDWLKSRLWNRGGSIGLILEERDALGGRGASGTGADGGSKGSHNASTDLRSKLSPHELGWLREYSSLITAYKSEYLDILDVALPLSLSSSAARSNADDADGTIPGEDCYDFKPPDELMVTVVATRDARDVMTEMGTLNLRRGERMRVRRMEVEGLIVRGWLVIAD